MLSFKEKQWSEMGQKFRIIAVNHNSINNVIANVLAYTYEKNKTIIFYKLTRNKVVELLENKVEFETMPEKGKVEVFLTKNGKFIKTQSDNSLADNLGELPSFEVGGNTIGAIEKQELKLMPKVR